MPGSQECKALVWEPGCHCMLGLWDFPSWATPTVWGPHSILTIQFFSRWQFLGCATLYSVPVPGQRKTKHRSKKRSQNSPSKYVFLLQHCSSCVGLYVWSSSPAFPLHRAPSACFFLSHGLLFSKLEASHGCQKSNLCNEAFCKTGLWFTNTMLQSERSFFFRSDHSRIWFGNEESFSSHDSWPHFPFYSLQTQATKTHLVLQGIALEIMVVKWMGLMI